MACMATPTTARPAPARAASSTRGRRTRQTICCCATVQSPPDPPKFKPRLLSCWPISCAVICQASCGAMRTGPSVMASVSDSSSSAINAASHNASWRRWRINALVGVLAAEKESVAAVAVVVSVACIMARLLARGAVHGPGAGWRRHCAGRAWLRQTPAARTFARVWP